MLSQIKFQRPKPSKNNLPRHQLASKIEASSHFPIVLVNAPAGYGKSTAVSNWLANRSNYAWLTLEQQDNNLDQLLRNIVYAIRQIEPNIGSTTLTIIGSNQKLEWRPVIESLLNDFSDYGSPFWLILDDLHLIKNESSKNALRFLLEHIGPTPLQVILLSRARPHLPIARWLIEEHLTELKMGDLQLSKDETKQFFGSGWRPEIIEAIYQQTDGWIVALQAIKLSASKHKLAELPSSSKAVIFEYLIDEVWQQLPENTQQFLLKTAHLTMLSAPLCNALTGRSDSAAQLRKLHEDQLFIIPLDPAAGTYRYHHLFAQMVQNRQQTVNAFMIVELHKRAAAWYQAQGQVEAALSHALETGSFDQYESIIVQFADEIWAKNQASRLHQWLTQMPPKALESRLPLRLLFAWTLLLIGQWQKLLKIELLAQVEPDDPTIWQGVAGCITTRIALLRNQPKQAIESASSTLTLIPADRLIWRGTLHQDLASGYRQIGNHKKAVEQYRQAVELSEAADNLYGTLNSRRHLGELLQNQGQLKRAESVYQTAIRWAEGHEIEEGVRATNIPAVGNIRAWLGRLHMIRWEPEQAQIELETAVSNCRQGQDRIGTVVASLYLAEIYHRQRDWLAAWKTLDEAQMIIAGNRLGGLTQFAHDLAGAFIAREAQFNQNDQTQQRLIDWVNAEGLHLQPKQGLMALRSKIQCCHLHLLGRNKLIIQNLIEQLPKCRRPVDQVETYVWLAVANWSSNRLQEADRFLSQALEMAQPEQVILPFFECGTSLIPILESNNKPFGRIVLKKLHHYCILMQQSAVELPDLTRRESDVATLLLQGLSNQEIANRLTVAESTVKTHLHNLFRKLSVTNRTQAIVRLQTR